MVKCIECDADLQVEEKSLEIGEIVICPECGMELEVLKASPVKLGKAPEEEEDWGE
jgi:alpha-aminoadipate carrier protein LysW